MRLALLVLLAALSASAPVAQSAGILVRSPDPRYGVDLPGLDRGADAIAHPVEPAAATVASPRGRAAWRGAKIGFQLGAVVTVAAVVGAKLAYLGCRDFCPWAVVAFTGIPFTAFTTGAGAAIGAATARPEAVPPPATAPGSAP